MNVLINAQGLDDKEWAKNIVNKAEALIEDGRIACNTLILEVESRLRG